MAANPDQLRKDAQKYTAKGKYEHAIGCYQELLKHDPTDAKLWINVGDLVGKLGHTKQAVQIYGRAAQQFAAQGQLTQAISVNKMILELEPKHTATQRTLQGLMQRAVEAKSAQPAEAAPPPRPKKGAPQEAPAEGQWHTPLEVDYGAGGGGGAAPEAHEAGGISFGDDGIDLDPADGDDGAGSPEFGAGEVAFDLSDDEALAEDGFELGGQAGEAMNTIMGQDVDPGALNAAVEHLPEIPLFSALPPEAFDAVMQQLYLLRFGPGDAIIQEGDFGDSFYVLADGRARVVKNDPEGNVIELATLKAGDFFGEFALLTGTPRSASVYADADDTQVLEFSREALSELTTAHPAMNRVLEEFYRKRLVGTILRISPLFQPLPADKREAILKHFQGTRVEAGTTIIRQGQAPEALYVIVSGGVAVSASDHGQEVDLATLKEGDVFGEIGLLSGKPATATCTTIDETRLYKLPGDLFRKFMASFPDVHAELKRIAKERLGERRQAFAADDTTLPGAGLV